jgi:hypothetical protein
MNLFNILTFCHYCLLVLKRYSIICLYVYISASGKLYVYIYWKILKRHRQNNSKSNMEMVETEANIDTP